MLPSAFKGPHSLQRKDAIYCACTLTLEQLHGFLPSLNMIEVNVYQVLCHKHDSLYRQDSGQKRKKRSKVIPEINLDGNQALFL